MLSILIDFEPLLCELEDVANLVVIDIKLNALVEDKISALEEGRIKPRWKVALLKALLWSLA